MARRSQLLTVLLALWLWAPPAAASAAGLDGTYRLGIDKAAAAADFAKVQAAVNRAPARGPIRADLLGATQNFFAYNFATGKYITVPSTLRKVGGHCYLYVENAQWNVNVTQNDLDKIASAFDGAIYPTTTASFGQEWSPGIDNDVRITILILDIRDSYLTASTFYTGYFSFLDEMPDIAAQQPPHKARSNEREMFYMDCFPVKAASEQFMTTLSHEFQHMIHWHQNPNEEEWVDEGMSDLSAFLNGYGVNKDHFGAFLRNPAKGLLPFDGTLESYGVAFAYIDYLYHQYGGSTQIEQTNFLKKLTNSGDHGLGSIQSVLNYAGYPDVSPTDVYRDFCTMLFLDAKGIPKFSVPEFEFEVAPTFTHSGYPVRDRSWNVDYWSRQYVQFESGSGESRILKFLGAETGHFAVRLIFFNKDGSVTVEDVKLNNQADAFYDLHGLSLTYSKAVMIVMYAGDTGPQSFRYNVGFAGPRSAIYPNPIFVDDVNVTVVSYIPPVVTVKRVGGTEDKLKMKLLQKGLWTGTYHVPQSGLFEVSVYGEDEEGLSGTITSEFDVRKLARYSLNMIAYDGGAGRVNLALGRSSSAQGSLYLSDGGAALAKTVEAAGLEYVAGVDLAFAGTGEPADATIAFPAGELEKSGLVAVEGDTVRWIGGARAGEELSAGLDRFVPHAVAIDRTPPVVTRAQLDGTTLTLDLSDAGSGLDPAATTILVNGGNAGWRTTERGAIAVDLASAPPPVDESVVVSVVAADRCGNRIERMVPVARAAAPGTIAVYPNPARSVATVDFGRIMNYSLRVFDAAGRAVRSADAAGRTFAWDLANERGDAVANGTYLIEVRDRDGGAVERRRVGVLR